MIKPKPESMRAAALGLLRVAASIRPSARDVAAEVAARFGEALSEKTVRRWAAQAGIKLTARSVRKDRRSDGEGGG